MKERNHKRGTRRKASSRRQRWGRRRREALPHLGGLHHEYVRLAARTASLTTPGVAGFASTYTAGCTEEQIFVLPLSPDVGTRSHCCVANFRGRADRQNWLTQTPDREAEWSLDQGHPPKRNASFRFRASSVICSGSGAICCVPLTIAFTDWVEGPAGLSDAEAVRFMGFMKFGTPNTVEDYRSLLEKNGCDIVEAEDTGRFAPAQCHVPDLFQCAVQR